MSIWIVEQQCEGNLPTALEAMKGAELRIARSSVAQCDGIWLHAARKSCDKVGGNGAIPDTHPVPYDASEAQGVVVAWGHVGLWRPLPIRAESSGRLALSCQPKVCVGACLGIDARGRA